MAKNLTKYRPPLAIARAPDLNGDPHMSHAERLILLTRLPRPGYTKTRLIPSLGPEGAADLQRRMTESALSWARALRRVRPVELEVCYTGHDSRQMSAWLGPGVSYEPQDAGGLGRRMKNALHRALDQGCLRAVLMGSDIPGINRALLGHAFDLLKTHQVVLGPAMDGGYYLVGLSRPAPDIFQGIEWGSSRVFKQTMRKARAAGLDVAQLPPLADLDCPQDLPLWHDAPAPPPAAPVSGLISVVIPCLNEHESLAQAVDSVGSAPNVEIIVADGYSQDGTEVLALDLGCRLVRTPRGRGGQLAAGCHLARGQYLLMLHADTRLPQGWQGEVRRLLSQPQIALGAFRFAVDQRSAGLRLVEIMVALRSNFLHMPYGDQALFLRTRDLRAMGGVPDMDLMEDVALVRSARELGKVAISPLPAVSSARRWQKKGLWGNTLHNWLTFVSYSLGVDTKALARRYYRHRRNSF